MTVMVLPHPLVMENLGALFKFLSAPIGELLHLTLKIFVLVRVLVLVRVSFGLSP